MVEDSTNASGVAQVPSRINKKKFGIFGDMVTDKDKKQMEKREKKVKPPELADITSWMAEQSIPDDENASLAKPSDIKKLDMKVNSPRKKSPNTINKNDGVVTSKNGVQEEELLTVETIINSPKIQDKKFRGSIPCDGPPSCEEEGKVPGKTCGKKKKKLILRKRISVSKSPTSPDGPTSPFAKLTEAAAPSSGDKTWKTFKRPNSQNDDKRNVPIVRTMIRRMIRMKLQPKTKSVCSERKEEKISIPFRMSSRLHLEEDLFHLLHESLTENLFKDRNQ